MYDTFLHRFSRLQSKGLLTVAKRGGTWQKKGDGIRYDDVLAAQVSGGVRSTVGMIVVSTMLPKIFKTIFAQDWEDDDRNCVLRNFNKLTWCLYFIIVAVEIACCVIIRYDPNAWAEALKSRKHWERSEG